MLSSSSDMKLLIFNAGLLGKFIYWNALHLFKGNRFTFNPNHIDACDNTEQSVVL